MKELNFSYDSGFRKACDDTEVDYASKESVLSFPKRVAACMYKMQMPKERQCKEDLLILDTLDFKAPNCIEERCLLLAARKNGCSDMASISEYVSKNRWTSNIHNLYLEIDWNDAKQLDSYCELQKMIVDYLIQMWAFDKLMDVFGGYLPSSNLVWGKHIKWKDLLNYFNENLIDKSKVEDAIKDFYVKTGNLMVLANFYKICEFSKCPEDFSKLVHIYCGYRFSPKQIEYVQLSYFSNLPIKNASAIVQVYNNMANQTRLWGYRKFDGSCHTISLPKNLSQDEVEEAIKKDIGGTPKEIVALKLKESATKSENLKLKRDEILSDARYTNEKDVLKKGYMDYSLVRTRDLFNLFDNVCQQSEEMGKYLSYLLNKGIINVTFNDFDSSIYDITPTSYEYEGFENDIKNSLTDNDIKIIRYSIEKRTRKSLREETGLTDKEINNRRDYLKDRMQILYYSTTEYKWMLTEKGKKVLNLIPQEDSCNENGSEEDNTLPNPKRGHKSRMVREALEGVEKISIRKTQAFLNEKGIEVSTGTIGNILKEFKAKDEKDESHLSVLKLLVEGKTIIEAANIIGMSEQTVKRYLKKGKKNGIIDNKGTNKFPKWVFLNEDTFSPEDILIFDDVPPLPDEDILNAGFDDWVNSADTVFNIETPEEETTRA